MTQKEALAVLKTGANVFLTGEAGAGKTYVVNEYASYLRDRDVPFALTASTGIAATHIRGMTIHSWSGIGIKATLGEDDVRRITENARVAKRIKKARVLIIDEISMLDGRILTLVERVCRSVKRSGLPFGGIQVVLVGDFFQLPPVASGGESAQFAFESPVWETIAPLVCYLSEQHRQEDDGFLDLLSALRGSRWTAAHTERLHTRIVSTETSFLEEVTRLFSHNANVDRINAERLRALPGKTYAYQMASRGREQFIETLKRGCLSPERLELKEGAAVMFTKNNQMEHFVNGTLGTVVGFDAERKLPIVKIRDGRSIVVEPMEWTIEEGETVLAGISQLPLRLAWAMTIHKSQGVSLDAAIVDLSQTFEFGQGYVALSRVRTLSGVHLLGTNDRAFQVHPTVSERDREFRARSEETAQWIRSLSSDDQAQREDVFVLRSGGRRANRDERSESKRKVVSAEKRPASERTQKRQGNAYQSWSAEEEKRLLDFARNGMSVSEIAKTLNRSTGAIRSRIKKLKA